jgi:hypothetical protein
MIGKARRRKRRLHGRLVRLSMVLIRMSKVYSL